MPFKGWGADFNGQGQTLCALFTWFLHLKYCCISYKIVSSGEALNNPTFPLPELFSILQITAQCNAWFCDGSQVVAFLVVES